MSTHVVLLPVKPPARGKSRLTVFSGLPDEVRRRLAEAFALDTAEACLSASSVGAVLVVTDDAGFSARLQALGCAAIPDGVSDDLNATLVQAAAEARRRWPDLVPVALTGDLPALRAADLDAALASVPAGSPAYVSDAEGVGTTLYTADAARFDPHFGEGSSRAHESAGARAVAGELASLRRDVDSVADLNHAITLGLGPRTAAVVEGLALS
ncbi:2-phospho-L-lactate guanylyltransferase [Nocardioides terrae]|uniref:2-phospho-L-lactate guanylyltransferase n=1 Tax=Nocardioides terrae TaxID=574651 RepID=A0A1I1J0R8_9ACTN|nr:2-phospho-L-lactate guanylyltransferase [Nocardioides terrae]SFC41731.1 2-phospho-L-lactate guanylyltransferase [Nocardioides terrae]